MKTYIGLKTWQYFFKSEEACKKAEERLIGKGEITEIFVQNGYGFEFREYNRELVF